MRRSLSLSFPCLPLVRITMMRKAIPALLLLLFTVYIGVLSAQNKACDKTCQDKQNGPCSGMTGKAFAQCLGKCMKACNPPPPQMDRGCSDRTIHGKITCTIVRPDVQVHEQKFDSSIRFAPGD